MAALFTIFLRGGAQGLALNRCSTNVAQWLNGKPNRYYGEPCIFHGGRGGKDLIRASFWAMVNGRLEGVY